jgi:broad specificity phosphatase PhoE
MASPARSRASPMPLLYLVRHGRVTATPEDARDPELDPLGWQQADAAARELAQLIAAPLPVLTSPLRRCRETALPLLGLWQCEARVEPRVVEVPSPDSAALSRDAWLNKALHASWDEAARFGEQHEPGYADKLRAWRESVRAAALDCAGDTVIFSHYVPINVLVGHALDSPRIATFRPGNGSITILEVEGGAIRLRQRGREVDSRVV